LVQHYLKLRPWICRSSSESDEEPPRSWRSERTWNNPSREWSTPQDPRLGPSGNQRTDRAGDPPREEDFILIPAKMEGRSRKRRRRRAKKGQGKWGSSSQSIEPWGQVLGRGRSSVPRGAEGRSSQSIEPWGQVLGRGRSSVLRGAEGRISQSVEPLGRRNGRGWRSGYVLHRVGGGDNPLRGAEGGEPLIGTCLNGGSESKGSLCPGGFCEVRSRRLRCHVVGCHLPPVFRRSVPRCGKVLNLKYRALRWLAETLLGVGASLFDLARLFTVEGVFGPHMVPWSEDFVEEMEAFCCWGGVQYPPVWPLSGVLHPAMLLHWRVQCQVLGLLSHLNRQRYVGLLANKVVEGCRLAEYPNQMPPSNTSWRSDGNLRRRRAFAVVSDPVYTSGCPIPHEPFWGPGAARQLPPQARGDCFSSVQAQVTGWGRSSAPLRVEFPSGCFPGGGVRPESVG
jgi:hypothetical protein